MYMYIIQGWCQQHQAVDCRSLYNALQQLEDIVKVWTSDRMIMQVKKMDRADHCSLAQAGYYQSRSAFYFSLLNRLHITNTPWANAWESVHVATVLKINF